MDEREDTTIYKVVVNHEEQYSIWPADRENALGWNDAGKTGTKQECLDYIKEVWTDMRPLSLRKKMEEAAAQVFTGRARGNWLLGWKTPVVCGTGWRHCIAPTRITAGVDRFIASRPAPVTARQLLPT